MKNKLTVNRLAMGNLKARKKQYAIMIVGIILAMVFSSSVVLFFFSAQATANEDRKIRYGTQSDIVMSDVLTEKDYDQAIADGYITEYHYMHNIGYAYPEKGAEYLGATVTWMDGDARDMYYLRMQEGEYPTAPDEAAMDITTLKRLGYNDAHIGDKIKVKLDVQNSNGRIVDKEYTLVGIAKDRKCNLEETYSPNSDIKYDTMIPGIYVAEGTEVEPGGKETLLVMFHSDYKKEFVDPNNHDNDGDRFSAPSCYFRSLAGEDAVIRGGMDYSGQTATLDALFRGGDYMGIVLAALIFASCVAIINSFNTNLKERKKQIGLLRAVGTTRKQVINIFGREALIISLIATPVSTLASYIIVRLLLMLLGDTVMTRSLWALVISAVVNVVVVMLAALIPLCIASRTTPMQAIRNIDISRKAKNKKVRSKTKFDAATHLARRNTKFYKGSTIAGSIMLSITILFSCLAMSSVAYERSNIRELPNDYIISDNLDEMGEDSATAGFTEIEKQSIEAHPYVKAIYGVKQADCEIEVDEITDYVRIVDSIRYENNENFNTSPTSTTDLRERMMSDPDDNYTQKKATLGIKREMMSSRVMGYDDDILAGLEKYVIAGKIDYDKLTSGEEVIFVCPQRTGLYAKITKHLYGVQTLSDDQCIDHIVGYDRVMYAESEYKVGDELTFCVSGSRYDEEKDTMQYSLRSRCNARIGAIISPASLDYYKTNGVAVYTTAILTNIQGINNLVKGINYEELRFDVNMDIDAEKNEAIQNDLTPYKEKHNSWPMSRYEETTFERNNTAMLLAGIIALVIIGFAICVSIINNSITAQIRENKRVIGTLRAVGADRKVLISSYIRQMISMFGWGIGFGYGGFLLAYLVISVVSRMTIGGTMNLVFSPWATIGMTLLAIGICSINVSTRIRRETRNSIVDNIREL